MLLFTCILCQWAPEPVRVVPLVGINSPSGLIVESDQGFFAVDQLDPIPGVAKADLASNPIRSTLVFAMSDYYVRDLAMTEDHRAFVLIANTAINYDDRTQHIQYMDIASKMMGERKRVDWSTYCQANEPCRATCALLRDESLVLATDETPSSLIIFQPTPNGDFQAMRRKFVQLKGTLPLISDMQNVGATFMLLIRNQWAIARANWSDLSLPDHALPLEIIFDFKHLKRSYRTVSLDRTEDGLAEAFAIAEDGSLWVLFSTLGYARETDGMPHPLLLQFRSIP